MRFGPYADSAKVVEQALSFQRPDRLPVYDGFWPEFGQRWRTERPDAGTDGIEEYYWIDLDVPVANECLFPSRVGVVREDGQDVYRDDGWGRIVRTRPGTYFMEPVSRLLETRADLDRIVFEPAAADSRYTGLVAEARRQQQRGRAVFVKIGGLFIRSSWFRGETEFLMDMVLDPGYARAVVEKMAAHLLQTGLESLHRARAESCGVWVFDDMCNARGPMFSPAVFETIFLPVYQHLVQTLKAAGARRVLLHCDGNLTPLLDLVVAAGFDGINPVEFEIGRASCRERVWTVV